VGYSPLARSELPVNTVSLARYLVGKILVRELTDGVASGRIVETEAYAVGDVAGHAYRGMTPRNRSLFLERGHAYVYLAYGSSYMLNVSSEISGIGAGVLIRALEPLEGIPILQRNRGAAGLRDLARGPGRLATALRVDRRLDGSICAEEARYGWDAMISNPARSAGASESALPASRTACCGIMSAAIGSSAVQRRSTNEATRPQARRRLFRRGSDPYPLRRRREEPAAGGALILVDRALMLGRRHWQPHRHRGEARRQTG
jgi:DNA-3-methyladenine glycosylase